MSSQSHQSWIVLRRYSVDNLMKIYDDSFDHFIASVVHRASTAGSSNVRPLVRVVRIFTQYRDVRIVEFSLAIQL